ncbi:Phospholipase B-like [Balamuthia mandrillaris]
MRGSRTLLALLILVQVLASSVFVVGGEVAGRKASSSRRIYVHYDPQLQRFTASSSLSSARSDGGRGLLAAFGDLTNALNLTGWDWMHIYSNPTVDQETQMYGAGFSEGALTSEKIATWYHNVHVNLFNNKTLPKSLYQYLTTQMNWARSTAEQKKDSSVYWQTVWSVFRQMDGLLDGYTQFKPSNGPNLDILDFYVLNAGGDLEDLVKLFNDSSFSSFSSPLTDNAYNKNKRPSLVKQEDEPPLDFLDCSAIIRLLPNNAELFAGHTTWSDYYSMNRIFKHYHFGDTSAFASLYSEEDVMSNKKIESRSSSQLALPSISFSARPGMLTSKDDFYVLSSGLTVLETTNGIYNDSLYEAVKPEGSVLCWMRVMVANLLARNGTEWTDIFALHNSGTYNNQWMIVDYNLFAKVQQQQSSLLPNTLRILEQIPGKTVSSDVTDVLVRQGYWPSYNVPYTPYIYNISGWPQMKAKYGDSYSYERCPRANIFRRNVTQLPNEASWNGLKAVGELLQYNNWQEDPLSLKRPNLAISSRYDLLQDRPPIAFGGIDSKLISFAGMKGGSGVAKDGEKRKQEEGGARSFPQSKRILAISGPTHQQQKPFTWDDPRFSSVAHEGQPTVWNFDWVTMNKKIGQALQTTAMSVAWKDLPQELLINFWSAPQKH